MAKLTIRGEETVLEDPEKISDYLSRFGIWYRRFEGSDELPEDADSEAILEAYREPIEELKREGGYVTADVIAVNPDTPGLEAMLAKFDKEHWHEENEVRFIVHGRGIFHIHPEPDTTFAIEVTKGDMINVPKGTLHWFDLCAEKTIRAIRLFQDMSGWTPYYTDSGADKQFQPVCMGPQYFPAGRDA